MLSSNLFSIVYLLFGHFFLPPKLKYNQTKFSGILSGENPKFYVKYKTESKINLFTKLGPSIVIDKCSYSDTEYGHFLQQRWANITHCSFSVPLWYLRGSRLFHEFPEPQQLEWLDLQLRCCTIETNSYMFTLSDVYLKPPHGDIPNLKNNVISQGLHNIEIRCSPWPI